MHVFCIYLHNDLHLVCMCRPWGPISTIFKLLLSNSHSVEVPPGFMESNFHDSGLSPRPPPGGLTSTHPLGPWRSPASSSLERVTPNPCPRNTYGLDCFLWCGCNQNTDWGLSMLVFMLGRE